MQSSAPFRICFRCDQPINSIAESNDDGRGHFLCNECARRLQAAQKIGAPAGNGPFRICYQCEAPIRSVAETADDGQGHFLCLPCAARGNQFPANSQAVKVVQQLSTKALAEQYQSIMADLVLAMNRRDRAEADHLVSDLASSVKVIQDTCGWETMDAHLENGPFTRAARQMVSAKYRSWCNGDLELSANTYPAHSKLSTPVAARPTPALHEEQPRYVPRTAETRHPNTSTQHALQQTFVPGTASTDMASSHLQTSLSASTDPFETRSLPVHSGKLPWSVGTLESSSKLSAPPLPSYVQQHPVPNPAPKLLQPPAAGETSGQACPSEHIAPSSFQQLAAGGTACPSGQTAPAAPQATRQQLTWQSMPNVLLENWGSWEELEWHRLLPG